MCLSPRRSQADNCLTPGREGERKNEILCYLTTITVLMRLYSINLKRTNKPTITLNSIEYVITELN